MVREDATFCYRAEAGRIRLGRVTLGADVVVAEQTVLDIDTAVGDGGLLGHCSRCSRASGAGRQHWHGSPAEPRDAAPGGPAGPLRHGRRFWFSCYS